MFVYPLLAFPRRLLKSLFTNFDYGASHWDKLFERPPENISIVEKQNFKESEIFYKLGLRGRLMGLHIELLSGVWAWDDDDGDADDGGDGGDDVDDDR